MEPGELWPLAVYFGAVLFVLAVMLGVPAIAGQRHDDPATGEPYEAGIASTGDARTPFSIKFYFVAILFVIFDLEVVFIFAWAVSARDVGWVGYAGALVFILVLIVGLIYEWKQGALDWSPRPRGRRTGTSR
jgi:NADH-quinone oxidoreductase subunit A